MRRQLTSAQTLTFAYDALGRNVRQSGPSGDYLSRYDPAGRRTRLTHPDGFFVDQDYLVTGEMVKIRERVGVTDVSATTGIGVLATYEYDALGRRDRLILGNGAVTDYQYDDASRLWKLRHDPAGGDHDNEITLTYNPAGQIVRRAATNNAYAWTGHGNGSTSYATDGLNRLDGFSHDARGNRLSDGTRSYAYDSENRGRGVATAPWHYDPLGRLSGVSTSAGAPPAIAYESYVDNLIAERTPGSSTVRRRHVFGPGTDEPLVWYEGSGTTDRRFLQADERGSIVAVSNGSGVVQNINTYDEYGRTAETDPYWLSRFGFTGQRYFGGFGLYHYKNRIYDPGKGRFMQPDPIGYGAGMNLYAYVGGDPINRTDPLGLKQRDRTLPPKHDSGGSGGGGGGGQTIVVTGNRADQAMRDTLVMLNRIATHEFIHRAGMGSNGESPNDDIDGDGKPDPDIEVTGTQPPTVKIAQLDIDMRTPLQRMDDHLGITDAVEAGRSYLRNCVGGLSEVDRERAAVAGSKGAIKGAVVGGGRGAAAGSFMGPAGSGWGATGGAVTGTLSGAARGIITSVARQACQAGNPG